MERSALLFFGHSDDDPQVGLVGHPLVCCEIRLKNWDEGNYRNTDFPHPRGEILLGGSNVARGYFRGTEQDEANFQIIDGTKYFCTGDIGEIFSDGSLKIIGETFERFSSLLFF